VLTITKVFEGSKISLKFSFQYYHNLVQSIEQVDNMYYY
jgi:hypothetical protein